MTERTRIKVWKNKDRDTAKNKDDEGRNGTISKETNIPSTRWRIEESIGSNEHTNCRKSKCIKRKAMIKKILENLYRRRDDERSKESEMGNGQQ